jgi:DNA polymerase I
MELCKHTRQLLSDVARMGQSQMVEWLLIREAHRAGELVPNKPTSPELVRRQRETYEGGYVLEPRKGLHENIVSLDFRSLYPTIIVTHNVDMSTLDCDCCPGENQSPTGHHFCSKRQGFIPSILSGLVERRAEIKAQIDPMSPDSPEYKRKDATQYALKILSNSFYGYSGYPQARWYSKECAESVAAWGRHYIVMTIDAAEKEGFQVLYSDTDSIFLTSQGAGGELVSRAKSFLEKMNRSLPGTIELEYQGHHPRGFFVSKKRYALVDEGGRIATRGLEVVRRDWSPVAKDTQRRVLRAILEDGNPAKAAELVRDAVRSVSERSVDLSDLIISTRMTKTIQSYEAEAPHVAVARRMAEGGEEVSQGSTIDYIVRRGSGRVGDRAQPVGHSRIEDYDVDYYVRRQVLPPSMRILSTFGYREEDLRHYKTKQRTLDRFGQG